MSSAPFPPLPVHWGARTRLLPCRPAFCLHRRGGKVCCLLLFACRPLPIWLQRRDCCPLSIPLPTLVEGERVCRLSLPARRSPSYLGQRRDCRPAARSFVRAGKEGASALFLSSRLPFPVYWKQRRDCRPPLALLSAPEKGEQLCCRPFRLLIPLPIEAKRCDYRPAVYSFVRAGEGVRRTAPLSACLPAHWGKKVRLAPCCPLLCPRRGRGSAVLIPFHLFPCPLRRQSAIVAPLSTPLAAPGKRKQPCCPCHLAAAPAIGAQNTVVVPSPVPLSALGKRRAGVSSAPFRLPCPVYWRQRRDCRPPLAPLSALWEGGGCITALPVRHPLPNGMQNRACPVFATPPPFAGQATAPPPSPSF